MNLWLGTQERKMLHSTLYFLRTLLVDGCIVFPIGAIPGVIDEARCLIDSVKHILYILLFLGGKRDTCWLLEQIPSRISVHRLFDR